VKHLDTIYLFTKGWLKINLVHSPDSLVYDYLNGDIYLDNYDGPGELIVGYQNFWLAQRPINDTTLVIDSIIADQSSTVSSGVLYVDHPFLVTPVSFYVASGDTAEITLPF
jgi:hypothetical protein